MTFVFAAQICAGALRPRDAQAQEVPGNIRWRGEVAIAAGAGGADRGPCAIHVRPTTFVIGLVRRESRLSIFPGESA